VYFTARRRKAYIGIIERCYGKLGLESLTRDASVSDVQMESCCQRLLQLHEMSMLTTDLTSCRLKVAQFYSVMSDGDICIPWNFEDVAWFVNLAARILCRTEIVVTTCMKRVMNVVIIMLCIKSRVTIHPEVFGKVPNFEGLSWKNRGNSGCWIVPNSESCPKFVPI